MNRVNKIAKLATSLGVGVVLFGSRLAFAADTKAGDLGLGGTNGAFGQNQIFGPEGTINPQAIVRLVFQVLLAAAILWVVYNIVLAGLKIAGAKDDAEKRKNGLKSIVNAAIGLVVALSAFAIVNTLKGSFNTQEALPCLKDGAPGHVDSTGTCIKDEVKTDSTPT